MSQPTGPRPCAGDKEVSPFDQAVLERLADSLLALPDDQTAALRQANPGATSLAQLREFVLGTLLRRYVGRCHIDTDSAQRSAVNAVRLLEVRLGWVWVGFLSGLPGWQC